jgi:polyhydroxyalkanoate synthesis regulator protein
MKSPQNDFCLDTRVELHYLTRKINSGKKHEVGRGIKTEDIKKKTLTQIVFECTF